MTVVRTDPLRLVRALRVLFVAAMALFAGCGGNTNVAYGTAVISVQSTSGTFLSYQVGIDSITLTRNDGIVVEPLATPQTVDFTKITDIAELLGSPAVPIGTYVSASITLDYTAASIWVDKGGQAIQVEPVATDGTVMSAAVITVTFDPNDPLVINYQQSTRLALDVNLAAFNAVTLTSSPPVVLVQPFLNASTAAVDSTPMRARGVYVTQIGVSTGFIMNARPFIDQISALGAETVNTTATTYFNINGNVYTGAAGLAALGALPESTLIAAYGTLGDLAGITPTFNATQVYAGLDSADSARRPDQRRRQRALRQHRHGSWRNLFHGSGPDPVLQRRHDHTRQWYQRHRRRLDHRWPYLQCRVGRSASDDLWPGDA